MSASRNKIFSLLLAVIVGLLCIGLLEAGGFAFLYFTTEGPIDKAALQKSLKVTLPEAQSEESSDDGQRPDAAYMHDHVLHPYMGYVMNYDAQKIMFNGEPVDLHINDYGFFGPKPASSPSKNAVSIGLFGGSVAAELYIYGREALIQALQQYPAFANKKIRLSSIALGGMRQPQQLMGLNYLLSMEKYFDIVINLDGFNEVALPYSENIAYHVSPYFPARWQFFAEDDESSFVTGIKTQVLDKRLQLAKWGKRVARWPFRSSYFSLASWRVYSNRNYNAQRALEAQIRDMYQASDRLSAQQAGPPYFRNDFKRSLPDSVALWRRTSLLMHQVSAAQGIAYFHILQPNQYVKGSKQLTSWEMANAFSPLNNWYRVGAEAGYPRLFEAGKALQRDGVAFFDATDVFKTVEDSVYKDTCCHYNDLGNAILARRIAAIVGDNWPGTGSQQ